MSDDSPSSDPPGAPSVPESYDPAAAFALLGDATRLRILRELWEAQRDAPDEGVPFEALRERAGVDDSGRFNYHLGKLTGRFVERGDDGYRLRFAGVPFARLFVGGFLLAAVGWFAALFAPTLPLAAACFALALAPGGVTNVLLSTLVQRMVPDDYLGRVSAILGSASVAVMPVGALVGGVLGERVGAWTTMAVGGLGLLWVAVYVAAVPSLRRLPAPADATTLR